MGKYINNNLIKDEYLIYETNYHWILYFNHLSDNKIKNMIKKDNNFNVNP